MKPIEAKTFKQLCELKRTCVESGDFWILVDEGDIYIHQQKIGEDSTQSLKIPRKTFDKFVRFYTTGKMV